MRKNQKDLTAEDWEKMMLKDNFISQKEMFPALICVASMQVGPDKKRVKKYLGGKFQEYTTSNPKKFDEYWGNLISSGFFSGGRVHVEKADAINLALMIGCAQGYIRRELK